MRCQIERVIDREAIDLLKHRLDVSCQTDVFDRRIRCGDVVRGLSLACGLNAPHGFEHQDRRAGRVLAAGRSAERVTSLDQPNENGDRRFNLFENFIEHALLQKYGALPSGSAPGQG
ncbi:hypothetical protein [Paraburkholderia terrae]|uniref:hypothetical protein n=1 Tax=Paraburkholderia terrae TaxID=311230 RepID=UPI00336540C7